MQTKHFWEEGEVPEQLACTEISAAPVISSTYIIAVKTEFICGSHTHYSTLALSSAWQDRTGQCSCNLCVKELWWSSLAQVNETCQLNLLDEWSVQAKQLFNYDDVRIRGPVWDVVSTRCHHTERNGFLLLLVGEKFYQSFLSRLPCHRIEQLEQGCMTSR